MSLGFNATTNRFYDKASGRFISRSRGLLSSVARNEYKRATELPPGFVTMEVDELERAVRDHAEVDIDMGHRMDVDVYFQEWLDEQEELDTDQEDDYE